MYPYLLDIHSIFRWLVFASLCYALIVAYRGWVSNALFTANENTVRHVTATIAHIQLVLGFTLYFQSPVVKSFFANTHEAIHNMDTTFFGVVHISLMLTAIVLITVGSALAKRRTDDKAKFRTMLLWYGVAFIIIIIAIPWPFSPLANRPYIRTF